jgi:hypothetical protein
VVDALDPPTSGFYDRLGFTPLTPGSLRMRILVKDLERLAAD